MIKRQKLWNSTLNNVSKKRLVQIKSGEYKTKPNKPIPKYNKAAKVLWNKARSECMKRWGRINALTLEPIPFDIPVSVHHFVYTRAQSPKDKYNQLNLCPMPSYEHDDIDRHKKKFHEWRDIIIKNAKKLGLETLEPKE